MLVKMSKKVLFALLVLLTLSLTISAATKNNTWYTVIRIIDGDTFEIKYKGKKTLVRLYGIDTPERNQRGYFKAAALLETLCFRKKIRMEFPGKKKRDVFGRLLATVYLKNGKMINQLLLEAGVAKLYKKSPLIINGQ